MDTKNNELPKSINDIAIRNLRRVMVNKAVSQRMLSKIANVSDTAVHNWMSKKNGITLDKLSIIANFFNMTIEDFFKTDEETKQQDYSVTPSNMLPLLSWVQAGMWNESTVYSDIKYLETPIKTKHNKCFVLQVRGDSMSCPTGKSYFDGCYIVVDPKCSKTPEDLNHKVVVARNGNNATVKEFVLDGNIPYLKPYNTSYPTLAVTEDTEIIGIVIGMWSY